MKTTETSCSKKDIQYFENSEYNTLLRVFDLNPKYPKQDYRIQVNFYFNVFFLCLLSYFFSQGPFQHQTNLFLSKANFSKRLSENNETC